MELCDGNDHIDACKLFKDLHRHNVSENEKAKLVENILRKGASLSDLICNAQGKKGSKSLFKALCSLPNGHLTAKTVLNSLLRENEDSLEIKLSSGLLFRPGDDHCESKVFEDLLEIRRQSQAKGSAAEAAVDEVLTHPVMEAFIRQKWHSARFLHFAHIRLWFLFVVAFSGFLRVEINSQLIRNQFNEKFKVWNGSKECEDLYPVLLDNGSASKCVTIQNWTESKTWENKESFIEKLTKKKMNEHLGSLICHPHVEALLEDSSRLMFLGLTLLFAISSLLFLVKTCTSRWTWPIRSSASRLILPVWQRRNETDQMNIFRDSVNFLTMAITSLMMLICFICDGQNLNRDKPTPFLDFDGGFVILEVILLLLAIYFIVNYICESRAHFSQCLDPSSIFQSVSSLAAIVTIVSKNQLTVDKNSEHNLATFAGAIGITLAHLGLILKYGRDNFTAIGNFATMFHIILKKMRSYMVVVFFLLLGFSFGFWVIAQHDERASVDTHFKGFVTSMKVCFVMFFGGFDNYVDMFDFDEEIGKGHHLTVAAFYILFLMMIVVTSLGMLNLLLAAIISDYKRNMKEVHIQNLIAMAQYSVFLSKCCSLTTLKKLLVSRLNMASLDNWGRLDSMVTSYTYCTLDLCSRNGEGSNHIHLEEEFRNIIKK